MIPLAFDLISTLVIGSILPVATTDFTIVPRSTVAILDASTSAVAPLSDVNPQIPATSSTTRVPANRASLRDFFMASSAGRRADIGPPTSVYEPVRREVSVRVSLGPDPSGPPARL